METARILMVKFSYLDMTDETGQHEARTAHGRKGGKEKDVSEITLHTATNASDQGDSG